MLTLNTSNRVTFTVNIQGTSSDPTVRCVIGDSPALTFAAKELQNGKYESLMDLPSSLGEGSHPFKIEVLLNGRIFTPIQTSVNVVQKTIEVQKTAEPVPDVNKTSFEQIKNIDSVVENKQVSKNVKQKKLTRLEKVVQQPVEKLKPRKTSSSAKVSESKIKIADIANEAADREVPSAAVQRQTIAVEHVVSIPLTLTKGEIIFK